MTISKELLQNILDHLWEMDEERRHWNTNPDVELSKRYGRLGDLIKQVQAALESE